MTTRPSAGRRGGDRPTPEVSVIIVNFNTKERLMGALDSLAGREGLDLETIVVDNASTDGSAAAAQAHPLRPRVIRRATNDGFAAGVNEGFRNAAGEVVILLNSDARVDPGALALLAACTAARPGLGAAGGRLRNPDGSRQATAFSLPTLLDSWLEFGFLGLRRPLGMRPAPDHSGPVGWVSGGFVALPRAALERIGPLDERFFLYAEDIDWCRRARAAGLDVHYAAEAGAVHEARGSAAAPGNWSPRAVAARLLYHGKHDGPAAAAVLRAALTINWVIALILLAPVGLLPGPTGARARRALGTLRGLITRAGAPR